MTKIMPKKTFLISLLLILLSTGCKSVRIKEKDAEKIEYTRIDSIFIERTFPLHDTIFVNIPLIITEKKECDSLCQKELNRWLLSVEASKKNGSLSQGIYFDQYKNQLVLYQNAAEQLNISKNNIEKLSQVKEKEHIKEIKKAYIPTFFWIMTFLGAIGIIVGLFFLVQKLKNIL